MGNINKNIKNIVAGGIIATALVSGANARLPDKNAFYTQNLGENIDTILTYKNNTKITLQGSTHFFNIFINKIKIEQSFDYEVGKENKIDLFDANTNLKFTAYLSIGKDTVLKLVSDPNCKLCAIDTLKISGEKQNIYNKKGEIIEENLQTILSVKKDSKNSKLYHVIFGFEKEFNSAEDVYSLLNLVLSYAEVYERHLNAVVGEFRREKIDFLAYRGKDQGLTPIYEPASATDYLFLEVITAPSLYNFKILGYGENYMTTEGMNGSTWIAPPYYSVGSTMAIETIGPLKEFIIKVGEEYNNLEGQFTLDWEDTDEYHRTEKRKKVEDMVYYRFSKNSQKYDTTKWIMYKIDISYPWPGVYPRAPPESYYFGKGVRWRGGMGRDLYGLMQNPYNSFYFFQSYIYSRGPPKAGEYPPPRSEWPEGITPPPIDSVANYFHSVWKTTIFSANRAKDGVYEWLNSIVVKEIERYYMFDDKDNPIRWWVREKSDTLLRGDSLTHLLPQNKFKILFPNKKQIIILDDNPTYKTIARDGFVKFNSLWLPKDTIAARVVGKIPTDGETSVSKKTFITIQFNEPIKVIEMNVWEDGKIKEGSWTLTNQDSTVVWWAKDDFLDNSKITYKLVVEDGDSNKTEVGGVFYIENPAVVGELKKDKLDVEFKKELIIYDLMGRVVARFKAEEEINLENIPTGCYIIKKDGEIIKKFLKIN
ncbi:MAG: T9SS type A sorting domain-containing protein [Candidatus Anstonellaceae archaeon]